MIAGGTDATRLDCGHYYHTACIKEVVEKAKGSTALLCPLCRASMYGPAPPFLCKPMTKRLRQDDDDNDCGKGPKVPPPVIPALLV